MILVTPATSDPIDNYLHDTTQMWDLDDFAAHCLFIWAAGSLAYHIATRLTGEAPRVKRLIWLGMLPSAAARFVMFATRQHTLYWILVCSSVIACLGWAAHVMVTELWGEPKHRAAVRIYLTTALTGIATCVFKMVDAINGHTDMDIGGTVWLGCVAATIGWAFGFGYSWQHRGHAIRQAAPAY